MLSWIVSMFLTADGASGIFFRMGWNLIGLELRFVIEIQTRLGLGLFKKKKKKLAIKL